jgi:hypothetical protein
MAADVQHVHHQPWTTAPVNRTSTNSIDKLRIFQTTEARTYEFLRRNTFISLRLYLPAECGGNFNIGTLNGRFSDVKPFSKWELFQSHGKRVSDIIETEVVADIVGFCSYLSMSCPKEKFESWWAATMIAWNMLVVLKHQETLNHVEWTWNNCLVAVLLDLDLALIILVGVEFFKRESIILFLYLKHEQTSDAYLTSDNGSTIRSHLVEPLLTSAISAPSRHDRRLRASCLSSVAGPWITLQRPSSGVIVCTSGFWVRPRPSTRAVHHTLPSIVAPCSQPPSHWSPGVLQRSPRQPPRQTPRVLWQRCHGYQTTGNLLRDGFTVKDGGTGRTRRGCVGDLLPDRVAVCIQGLDGLHLDHKA